MEKYTVKTAMRWIVERESWTVFEHETVLNGMLADLAFEEAKERQRIRLALSSGAGRQFYSFLRQGEGHPDAHDLLMLRTSYDNAPLMGIALATLLIMAGYVITFPKQKMNEVMYVGQYSMGMSTLFGNFSAIVCIRPVQSSPPVTLSSTTPPAIQTMTIISSPWSVSVQATARKPPSRM